MIMTTALVMKIGNLISRPEYVFPEHVHLVESLDGPEAENFYDDAFRLPRTWLRFRAEPNRRGNSQGSR